MRRPLASLSRAERDRFFSAVRSALDSAEAAAMEAAHEFGIAFTHHTSSLLLTHAAYFSRLIELVRRHSGQYELALPWILPHDQSAVELMNEQHPECLDCHRHPPTRWSPTQVAQQVREELLARPQRLRLEHGGHGQRQHGVAQAGAR